MGFSGACVIVNVHIRHVWGREKRTLWETEDINTLTKLSLTKIQQYPSGKKPSSSSGENVGKNILVRYPFH